MNSNKHADVVRVTIELTPEQAAGLCRLTDKTGFPEAMAVLYSHLPLKLRNDQAAHILQACDRVQRALGEAGVGSWPWIESGRAH